MSQFNVADSLGTRIVSAARMAVAMHLAMSDRQSKSLDRTFMSTAMIGGTDRRVTEDQRLETMNDERAG